MLGLDEGAGGMIAPPSGTASHQVMQIAGRTRIPVVTLCSDSSVSGSGIPWVVRMVPRSDLEAEAIFQGITNAAAAKRIRWAALVPDGREGREAAKDLRKAAEKVGVSLRDPVSLSAKEEQWRMEVRKLLASPPEGILLWMDAAWTGKMARHLREGGFKGLLAGPSRLRSIAFIEEAGPAAEGCIIPRMVGAETNSTLGKSFGNLYQKQFGSEPDFMATASADAAIFLGQLLRAGGEQPPYRAFPLKQEFMGVSGKLIFDKDGNRLVPLGLMVCRGGEFQPLDSVKH